MKKRQGKRHTPEQIIRKLREADTMLAAEKTIGQRLVNRRFRNLLSSQQLRNRHPCGDGTLHVENQRPK